MRNRPLLLCLGLAALSLAGCGGSSSGGPSGQTGPAVSLVAAGPDSSHFATGFDASGTPVYAARDSVAKWTVYASKDQPLYEIALDGLTVDSGPEAVSGGFVVGNYRATADQGVIVASRNGGGTVSVAKHPGYAFVLCDAGKALLSRQDNLDLPPSYFMMDLATGTAVAEPIPAGARPVALKGRFVLCEAAGTGSAGALVYDAGSDASAPLQAPAGTDGTVAPLAVNRNGQALGFAGKGGVAQLRVWSPAGVPGDVLDTSAAGGSFFLGWLSADGSRMAYKKVTPDTETQFLRAGGVGYDLAKAGSPFTSLNGLNDDGTLGFAADLSSEESAVTVAISYR